MGGPDLELPVIFAFGPTLGLPVSMPDWLFDLIWRVAPLAFAGIVAVSLLALSRGTEPGVKER
jgi:hypothetical protein